MIEFLVKAIIFRLTTHYLLGFKDNLSKNCNYIKCSFINLLASMNKPDVSHKKEFLEMMGLGLVEWIYITSSRHLFLKNTM